VDRTKAPAFVVVGRVVKPHGVRGELRVEPDTDFPERLSALREVTLLKREASMTAAVRSIRPHGNSVLIMLEGIDTIDAASRWRDAAVVVRREGAAPLEAGRHYVFDVLGLRVETEDGRILGTVAEVLRTGSNDVYVVRMPGPPGNSRERISGVAGTEREVLVPAISTVVLTIDVAGGRIIIRPMPGMLETG
jgi:16S rRNA processing protein RimM